MVCSSGADRGAERAERQQLLDELRRRLTVALVGERVLARDDGSSVYPGISRTADGTPSRMKSGMSAADLESR